MADNDRRISDSLQALAPSKVFTPGAPPAPRANIPAQTGKATRVPPVPVGGGGGGFASPLTETAYTDRVSFPSNYITTSDGAFTVQCLKTIKFKDANNNDLVVEFKAP